MNRKKYAKRQPCGGNGKGEGKKGTKGRGHRRMGEDGRRYVRHGFVGWTSLWD